MQSHENILSIIQIHQISLNRDQDLDLETNLALKNKIIKPQHKATNQTTLQQ